MDWSYDDSRAERALDVAAAAMFAAAVAFAGGALVADSGPAVAIAAAPAFLLAYTILRKLPADERAYPLAEFEPATIEPMQDNHGEATAELLLDDRLGGVDPGARVVQLFDPRESLGGELRASAIRSRGSSHSDSAPPDASQALSDALAELRRSLR